MMQLSILVVSRTAALLSSLLASLDQASSLPADAAEVLCSWNGSGGDELKISNPSRYQLHIVQRDPYHFSSNVNGLIEKASGSLLMLVNDDVLLDPGCVDAGIRLLTSSAQIGMVGALLRTDEGRLSHLGIGFDHDGNPYHVLDQKLTQQQSCLISNQPVAAVTGALQWLRRCDSLPLNTLYRVCGEDVELCLAMQQQLGKQVWLCSAAQAVHNGETTRQLCEDQGASVDDQARLRQRWADFVAGAPAAALAALLKQQQWESHMLRVLDAEAQVAHASRCSAQDQQHQTELQTLSEKHQAELQTLSEKHQAELQTLSEKHQAAIEALTDAYQAELTEQRDALKAERSLQFQQARQARRLLDDLQAERLHLKAMLERSLLPAGPGHVKP